MNTIFRDNEYVMKQYGVQLFKETLSEDHYALRHFNDYQSKYDYFDDKLKDDLAETIRRYDPSYVFSKPVNTTTANTTSEDKPASDNTLLMAILSTVVGVVAVLVIAAMG